MWRRAPGQVAPRHAAAAVTGTCRFSRRILPNGLSANSFFPGTRAPLMLLACTAPFRSISARARDAHVEWQEDGPGRVPGVRSKTSRMMRAWNSCSFGSATALPHLRSTLWRSATLARGCTSSFSNAKLDRSKPSHCDVSTVMVGRSCERRSEAISGGAFKGGAAHTCSSGTEVVSIKASIKSKIFTSRPRTARKSTRRSAHAPYLRHLASVAATATPSVKSGALSTRSTFIAGCLPHERQERPARRER